MTPAEQEARKNEETERDRIRLEKLKRAKQDLSTMLNEVSKFYAALVDQQDILGQLDYILQDSKHKLDVDYRYYVNKINYYSSIDYIPTLNNLLNLDTNSISNGGADIRQQIIVDTDEYIDEIKKKARDIDGFRSGCGYQISEINRAITAIDGEIRIAQEIYYRDLNL